jgi:hypothetical protein
MKSILVIAAALGISASAAAACEFQQTSASNNVDTTTVASIATDHSSKPTPASSTQDNQHVQKTAPTVSKTQ